MSSSLSTTTGGFDLRAYERLADLLPRLLATESLESLLGAIADAVSELIPCSAVLVFELREPEQTLVPVVARGLPLRSAGSAMVPNGERLDATLEALAIASARPALAGLDSRAADEEAVATTSAAAPLVVRGRPVGCLTVHRRGPNPPFGDDELRFLARLADVAAISLDNARTRATLAQLAQTDELTGLLNRRGFFSALERVLAQADRDGSLLSVLTVDVDDLKTINDRYGHSAGDDALCRVAETLTARARRGDIVGRLGGDEFAVVLLGATAEAAAEIRLELEEILRRARIETASGPIAPAASFGISTGPGRAETAHRLVAASDADMYASKSARKRHVPIAMDT